MKRKNNDLTGENFNFKSEIQTLKNQMAIYMADNEKMKLQIHKDQCDHEHSHEQIDEMKS